MDPKIVGENIKKIRKKNNLTQKQFADKYQVTYQAVSKWENGINMPDITLLKQISKDNNISIDNLLGENKKKKNIFLIPIIIIILLIILIIISNNRTFNFKTISSTCKDFKVSGCIAYNNRKTSISISKINYCKDENQKYKSISCSLYQKKDNTIKKISECKKEENISLNDYLKNLELNKDNYKSYNNDSLFLEIYFKDQNNNTFSHKIPLKTNTCN